MSINIKLLSLLGVLAFIVVVGVYVLRRQSQRLRLVQSSEGDVRFQSLTELTSDCYWEMDAEFRFTRLEGSMALSQGLISESDLGLACWDIPAFHLNQAQCDACRTTLQPQALFRGLELQRQLPSGDPCWIALSGSPCFDGKGVFTGYRGAGCDITRRKLDVQRIEQLAYFDELTSLPNRRSLAQHLKQALQALTNHPRHGALMFIDLDNFKTINDVQGRELGNVLLQQVAQRLTESVRDTDTVARIGSDEFVVLLNELSAYAGEATFQANGVGKAIMARLNQPYDILGQSFHSTPSIGVALFNDPLKSGEELLKRAEMAMSHAKTAGRNVMRFYDPDMEAAASELAALEAELRQGLQLGELRLHYQPVVDELSRLSGVEALVRWQHPKRGLLLPIEFIELAEKSGLIMPLGQWVLETACQQLVSWSELETTRELSMAVNVSARQFHQPDFVTKLLDLLRRTQANPFRLKLELTESLLLADMADAVRKMTELRAIGVSFALDDFGTGYSSLSYLKTLPLDQLKIDQSFVRDVLTNPNDAAIVRSILALAHSLDLTTVAEGVETEGQRQFLLDNGCWAFQGHLFGKSEPLDKLPLNL